MRKWTSEIDDYLREISLNKDDLEIANLINQKFNTSFSKTAVQSRRTKLKIYLNDNHRRKYTPEVIEFILNNYKGRDNIELAKLLNEKFGLNTNNDKVSMFKANYERRHGVNLRTGINKGCFQKGRTPINKGTKGMFNVGGNKTSFKKGHISANNVPIGTERVAKDNYIEIKIKDGCGNDNWIMKHRYIYEKNNGPIPNGYKVMFADRNKRNFDLNNLILVSNREELIMNRNKLVFHDKDLTKTGHMIAKVMDKTYKLENDKRK